MNEVTYGLPRRLAAEGLGTAFLVSIVIGSGIMGERLANGNDAVALQANTLATGAGLVVLILMFGPVSGAHFNPAVSFVMALNRKLNWADCAAYALVQFAGAIAGAWAAHAMFGEPIVQISHKARDGIALGFSEIVATFGLVGTIMTVSASRPAAVPAAVGLYIGSAYWFTASTSFANPAVTAARTLSDSFAGIAPHSVAPFMAAQILGATSAFFVFNWLYYREREE